jgi:thiazole synthase
MNTSMRDCLTDVKPWLMAGGQSIRSRLLVGIEQYADPELVRAVLEAADADLFIITYDLQNTRSSLLLSDIDQAFDIDKYVLAGTTSFAVSADMAVKTARQLRDRFGINLIKLDVRDAANMPDTAATVDAAIELARDGFVLLPFIPPDRQTARRLEDLGCAAIRLMASPVGSYLGISDPDAMLRCIEQLTVPVIIEGGIGSPAHVAHAMELGATAVLVNTLIARAADPAGMATALRYAVLAGDLGVRSR